MPEEPTQEEIERRARELAHRLLNTPPTPRVSTKRDPNAPKRPRGRPRKDESDKATEAS